MLHFLEHFSYGASTWKPSVVGAYSSCVTDSRFNCKVNLETGSPFAKADIKLPIILWFYSCLCPLGFCCHMKITHYEVHNYERHCWSAICNLENLRLKQLNLLFDIEKEDILYKNPFMIWCVLFYESPRGVFKPPLKPC